MSWTRGVFVAAAWSATWAVGVALGVAAGAYLTVTSAAGAPGATALGATELLVLPLVAGGAVFVIALPVYLIVGRPRSSGTLDPGDRPERDDERDKSQDI